MIKGGGIYTMISTVCIKKMYKHWCTQVQSALCAVACCIPMKRAPLGAGIYEVIDKLETQADNSLNTTRTRPGKDAGVQVCNHQRLPIIST